VPSSQPPTTTEAGLLCAVDGGGRLVWASAPLVADDAGKAGFKPPIVRPNLADLNAFLGLDSTNRVAAMAGLREYAAWLTGADSRQPPRVQSVTSQMQNLMTTLALVVSVLALSLSTPTARGVPGLVNGAILVLMAIALAIALWAGLRVARAAAVDNRTYAANLRLFGEVATAWLGAIDDAGRGDASGPQPPA
jgi:hypothetical protein